MEIKDYLHLYLGCDAMYLCLDQEGYDWLGPYQGHITGRFIAEYQRGVYKDIKPILRQLSSMTEEECADVYTIVNDRILHPPTKDHTIRKLNNCFEVIRLDKMDTKLFIQFNALIYLVTEDSWRHGDGKPMIEVTRNLPQVYQYLLSKSFDLFGLIENGLAIDLETIKQ